MGVLRAWKKGVEVQTHPCSCKMQHRRLEKVAPENRNVAKKMTGQCHSEPFAGVAGVAVGR
jgi:hypothetical protein